MQRLRFPHGTEVFQRDFCASFYQKTRLEVQNSWSNSSSLNFATASIMTAERNNQRAYFRLSYPLRMRPTLILDRNQYKVSEVSECGLRFQIKSEDCFEIGNVIRGMITFSDGGQTGISGTIFRREKQEVVVAPLEGITFQRLVIEQRHIMSQFPVL